ncbi:MAG TPA: hypothetical protein VLB05_15345 [Dongiaceae bacterium]|nr:hypothetical protein [Dongiaceae bacterium]
MPPKQNSLVRLVGRLLGRSRFGGRAKPPKRPGEDEVFEHLWRTAAFGSARGRRFSIHQRNLLLFQMGKVASSALEVALIDRGINCFHCHSLRYEDEASRLWRLFGNEPSFRLAAKDLKLLAKHTALGMLVRWYRTNDVAPERRLKVITLTRDPVTWFVSQLLQRAGYRPGRLTDWHSAFTGDGTGRSDLGAATAELLRQVGRLVIETRPSAGAAAARERGRALAMAMIPPQPYIADIFSRALFPLEWFDEQFTPILGIDIRSLPDLAERGLAQRNLGFADLLVLRFEDLGRHLASVADFVGLEGFDLPPRNVGADKTHAAEILDAARSFYATELGAAFQRELWRSEYARACGYGEEQRARRPTAAPSHRAS